MQRLAIAIQGAMYRKPYEHTMETAMTMTFSLRVVSYYISNIDKSSTYSGFLKFLENKGVTATQVRLSYHKFSISAKLNIPTVCTVTQWKARTFGQTE